MCVALCGDKVRTIFDVAAYVVTRYASTTSCFFLWCGGPPGVSARVVVSFGPARCSVGVVQIVVPDRWSLVVVQIFVPECLSDLGVQITHKVYSTGVGGAVKKRGGGARSWSGTRPCSIQTPGCLVAPRAPRVPPIARRCAGRSTPAPCCPRLPSEFGSEAARVQRKNV